MKKNLRRKNGISFEDGSAIGIDAVCKLPAPVTVYAFMQSGGLANDRRPRFCFRCKELRQRE